VRLLLPIEQVCSMEFVRSPISYSVFMRFMIIFVKEILYYLYVMYLIKLNSNIFWDITPFSLFKINRHFVGTYRLHLEGRKIYRGRYQLPVYHTRWRPTVTSSQESGSEGMWKEVVVSKFRFQHLSGRSQENRRKSSIRLASRCTGRDSK
jgi:hypothetical protein